MFSPFRVAFPEPDQSCIDGYRKAKKLFLTHQGTISDDPITADFVISQDSTDYEEWSVLYHWILDSVKINKLAPVNHYVVESSSRKPGSEVNLSIRCEWDKDDPEEHSFYTELLKLAADRGIRINENDGIEISQFCVDASKRFQMASPLWLMKIGTEREFFSPSAPLDFPCPLDPIPSDKIHRICVTGYYGDERERIIAMINFSGALYQSDLTKDIFVLIAETTQQSEKTKHAQIWGIPLKDISWLERCFLEWSWHNI